MLSRDWLLKAGSTVCQKSYLYNYYNDKIMIKFQKYMFALKLSLITIHVIFQALMMNLNFSMLLIQEKQTKSVAVHKIINQISIILQPTEQRKPDRTTVTVILRAPDKVRKINYHSNKFYHSLHAG